MRFKYALLTIGQFILALIVTIFILYKLALIFDWVPPGFSPVGVLEAEMQSFKQQLHEASLDNDLQGKLSKVAYVIIVRTQNYFADTAAHDAQQNKLSKECEENSLMRFFMFMGGKSVESTNCIQQNLQIEHAIKELTSNPNPSGQPSIHPSTINSGTTPAVSTPQPKVTIINSTPTAPRSNTSTNQNIPVPGKKY